MVAAAKIAASRSKAPMVTTAIQKPFERSTDPIKHVGKIWPQKRQTQHQHFRSMSPQDGVKEWTAEGYCYNPPQSLKSVANPRDTVDHNMADKLPRRALYPSGLLPEARRRGQKRSHLPKPKGHFGEEKIEGRASTDERSCETWLRKLAKEQTNEEVTGSPRRRTGKGTMQAKPLRP